MLWIEIILSLFSISSFKFSSENDVGFVVKSSRSFSYFLISEIIVGDLNLMVLSWESTVSTLSLASVKSSSFSIVWFSSFVPVSIFASTFLQDFYDINRKKYLMSLDNGKTYKTFNLDKINKALR